MSYTRVAGKFFACKGGAGTIYRRERIFRMDLKGGRKKMRRYLWKLTDELLESVFRDNICLTDEQKAEGRDRVEWELNRNLVENRVEHCWRYSGLEIRIEPVSEAYYIAQIIESI